MQTHKLLSHNEVFMHLQNDEYLIDDQQKVFKINDGKLDVYHLRTKQTLRSEINLERSIYLYELNDCKTEK